jgi:predicted negative regulator of RcsB-dependent stress response
MARKRREAAKAEEQKKTVYRDTFQENVGSQVEQLGKGLEGRGKTILYGLLAVIAIAVVALILYSYTRRQSGAAQAALGKAIETSQAMVTASPMAGYTERTYATDKERSEAALAAFQDVAGKYGSPYSDRAKFFMAVEKLKLDRAAGITELQESVKSGDKETAALAKFALAQVLVSEGKLDEAAGMYSDLLSQSVVLPAKETVNFALAGIYEKQGKTADAAEIYFTIAKAGREAKMSDGKPLPMTGTAREAITKLEKIAPDKAKELPPEPSATEQE